MPVCDVNYSFQTYSSYWRVELDQSIGAVLVERRPEVRCGWVMVGKIGWAVRTHWALSIHLHFIVTKKNSGKVTHEAFG